VEDSKDDDDGESGDSSMKILWIVPGLMPDALTMLGKDATVVGGGWVSSAFSKLKSLSTDNEFCVLCLDHRECDVCVSNVHYVSFGRKGELNYRHVPKVIENSVKSVVSRFDPDIIHIHGTEYFYGCMSRDVYCGAPVVVSIQGVISECWIHYGGGLVGAETWWSNLNARLLKYGYTISRERNFWRTDRTAQERRVLRQHHYFLGRTWWDKACVYYNNPEAKYFSSNETLRDEFFLARRDEVKVKSHSIYCGGAAGYPLKGLHYLLRAIASLKTIYPDIQLRIAASEGEIGTQRTLMQRLKGYSYGAYLRRLIKSLGIERNVVALPSLSANGVVQELLRAELFVLPSLCENSPNSLGEAMLVGTPAIATYAGGISSIMRDGVEGRLVPTYSAASLSYAIHEAFEEPAKMQQMAKVARATAFERHDGNLNAQKLMAIYSDIIRDSKR